jgi:MFS transporter, putative metabolite:H+ symporter
MAASPIKAGARLDRLPISAFHYRILGLVAAGMFLDAFEIYLAAGVLAALVNSGWSDLAHNGWFISITFAGMVVGAWFAGVFGDRYGRRFSYQLNLLIFGLASLAAAAAPSMDWLITARFVMGLGLGAEIVVGYVTLSEFVPPLQRGRWGSALAAVTNSALFFSAFGGLLIIPSIGWRWMFVIAGVGALVVWYLRRALPESPRWLESKGRAEEAERVLSAIEAEVSRGTPLPPAADQPTPAFPHRSIAALFEAGMLSRTIVGSLVLIAINTVIYGFIAWLPTFMVKQGMSIVSSLGFTTLMSFGGPVGALAGVWLGDHAGRKPVLVGFSLATIALGFAYPFATSDTLLTIVGFALVTCVYVMVAVAWALYVPELFPTEIRMRGAGFCNTMGRLMTIITPQVVPIIFISAGVIGVVTMLAALLLIQAVAVAFFGIETRRRPLEALRPSSREEMVPLVENQEVSRAGSA